MFRWRGHHHIDKLSVGSIDGGGIIEDLGRTYYVNNITGKSSRGGRSWADAVDEMDAAIALHVAFLATHAASNRNIRNQIIVQGTNQKYEAMETLPGYCDIIGLGAHARGSGEGIAIIYESGKDGMSGNARGLNMYNMQIGGVGDYYCMDVTTLLRSRFEDCAFIADNENSTKLLVAAIRATTNFASVTLLRCLIGGTNGPFATAIGIDLNTCSNVANNTLIKDCEIIANTFGIKEKTTLNDGGMVIRENVIRGANGIAGTGIQAGLYVFIVNNSVSATSGITEAETHQLVNNTVVTS